MVESSKEKLLILLEKFLKENLPYETKKKIAISLIKFGDEEIFNFVRDIPLEGLSKEDTYLLKTVIDKLAKKLGLSGIIDREEKKKILLEISQTGDIGIIQRYLSSPDYRKRLLVIEVIEELGEESLAGILVEHLSEENHPFILSKLVKVIPRLSGSKFLDKLLPFFESQDDRIVSNLIEGVSEIEINEEVLNKLKGFLLSDSERIRTAALLWLKKINPDLAFELAVDMFESAQEISQKAAIFILGELDTQQAILFLKNNVLFSPAIPIDLKEKAREVLENSSLDLAKEILKDFYQENLEKEAGDEFEPEVLDEDLERLLVSGNDDFFDFQSQMKKLEDTILDGNLSLEGEEFDTLKLSELKRDDIESEAMVKTLVAEEKSESERKKNIESETQIENKKEEAAELMETTSLNGEKRDKDETINERNSDFIDKKNGLGDKSIEAGEEEGRKRLSKRDELRRKIEEEFRRQLLEKISPLNENDSFPDGKSSLNRKSTKVIKGASVKSSSTFNFIYLLFFIFFLLGMGYLGFNFYQDKLNLSKYQEAKKLFLAGNYQKALPLFEKLDSYRDSQEYKNKISFIFELKRVKNALLNKKNVDEYVNIIRRYVVKYQHEKFYRERLKAFLENVLLKYPENPYFSSYIYQNLVEIAKMLNIDSSILNSVSVKSSFKEVELAIKDYRKKYLQQNFLDKLKKFKKLNQKETRRLIKLFFIEAIKQEDYKTALLLKKNYFPQFNIKLKEVSFYWAQYLEEQIKYFLRHRKLKEAYKYFLELRNYQKGIFVDRFSFPPSEEKVRLYIKEGSNDKALQVVRKLYQKKKGYLSSFLLTFYHNELKRQIEKYLKQQNFEKAVSLAKELYSLNHSYSTFVEKAYNALIRFYLKRGEVDFAQSYYQEMLSFLGKKNPFSYPIYKEILRKKAIVLKNEREFEKAREIMEKVASHYQMDKELKDLAVSIDMLEAEDLYLRGEYQKSASILEKYYRNYPRLFQKLGLKVSLSKALAQLAMDKLYRGNPFEAQNLIKKAISIDNSNPKVRETLEKVYFWAANSYLEENKFDKAIFILKEGLKLLEGNSEYLKQKIEMVMDKKQQYLLQQKLRKEKVEEKRKKWEKLQQEIAKKKALKDKKREELRQRRMNKYLFIFKDSLYDDRGPGTYLYPNNPVFLQGSFDIKEFKVIRKSKRLDFVIVLREKIIKRVSDLNSVTSDTSDYDVNVPTGSANDYLVEGENGWIYQLFDIYIRYGKKGKYKKSLPGRNVELIGGWDKVIMVSPESARKMEKSKRNLVELSYFNRMKDDIIFPKVINVGTYQISFSLDTSSFEESPSHNWSFQLLIGNYDPRLSSPWFHIRPVEVSPTPYRFGGGTPYDGEPNIIDVLDLPRKSQFTELSNYDSYPNRSKNKYAKIEMFSFEDIQNMLFKEEK